MAEKNIKSRIIHKHDTAENWAKATSFIPKQGEIIVYDIDANYNYERLKIGDGVQNVNALPFYANSWEDLSDKPFGEVEGKAYLVEECSIVIGEDMGWTETSVPTTRPFDGFVEGKTYYVVFDGEVYPVEYDPDLDVLNIEAIDIEVYYGGNDEMTVCTASSDPRRGETHTFGMYTTELVMAQLDEQYIPDTIARVSDIEVHNTSETAHSDIRTSISDLSTLVGDTAVSDQISSAIDDETSIIKKYVDEHAAQIVKCFMVPFGQTGYINNARGYGLQGSVIDETNKYFTSMFLNSDRTELYILTDNYETGERVNETLFTYDGHVNDFCIFNNKIIAVNSSGNNVGTMFTCDYPALTNVSYVTAPKTLYNITTDGQYLYAIGSDFKIHKIDSTYSVVESYKFPVSDYNSLSSQGLTFHDGYFYLALSEWINSNQMSFVLKFSIEEGAVKFALLYHFDSGNEIEGVNFINGNMYPSFRTNGMCALNRAVIEPSMDVSFQFYRDYTRPFIRTTQNEEFYISDQASFFVDGSAEKPFRIPNLATDFIYPHFNQCILHIIGDHSAESLTFISGSPRIYVYLENAQVKNIDIYRCDNVVINGTSTSTIHGPVTLSYNNKVNFTNVTMDTNETAFTIAATNFTLSGVTYTGTGEFINMNDSRGKVNSIPVNASNFITANNSTMRYDASVGDNHAQFAKITCDDELFTKMIICNNYSGALNIFNFNNDMYFSSSCALTDVPTGMTNTVRLKTERLNSTSVIQRLYYGSTGKGYVEYMRYVPQSQVAGEWVKIGSQPPIMSSVTLSASEWTGSASPYSQAVTISGATANSKIDLQPTAAQIVALQNDDIMLMVENNSGTITAYAIGGKPASNYTMQALITEVTPV